MISEGAFGRRVPLAHLPTPLERLSRLSWVGGPRLWVKRDDCTGLGGGGNKTRKLEYLLADALARGSNAVVTFGAVQSNHARQTAAACARLGLECHVLLTRRAEGGPDYERLGNVQLDALFGAHVHMLDVADADTAYVALESRLEAAGKSVYRVPVGGSSALGARGYLACAAEIDAWCGDHAVSFSRIWHASASGGTQAGLVAGFHGGPHADRVYGVNVYHDDVESLAARVRRLVSDVAPEANPACVQVVDGYRGAGYGVPSASGNSALQRLARMEGLLLDPVYTAKAMAALLDAAERAARAGACDEDWLFVHTGGAPSLSAFDLG